MKGRKQRNERRLECQRICRKTSYPEIGRKVKDEMRELISWINNFQGGIKRIDDGEDHRSKHFHKMS